MRLLVFFLPVIAAAADFTGFHQQSIALAAGETVEVYAGLPQPSQLPANGRIAVEWAGYRKVIHAHDPDFYIVYRAPKAAAYTLKLTKVEDEEPIFNRPRWRETGTVEKLTAYPKRTPWPTGHKVALRTKLAKLNPGASTRGMVLEAEPNDAIASAQSIDFGARDTLHITGGADDAEYFDNGLIGASGLDYFRIEYKGATPKLFTANLALPDPLVVAQLLVYTADGKEYRTGANANERVHQQTESHRTAITRTFQPGGVYFLKVEANSPGYEVELRLRDLAPHSDPRKAVQQAIYDHMGQVDAWILNRPRGAAVDRRIRDTGNLMGTHCMSCHTQSGVWGPTVAFQHGYRPENIVNYRHLVNTMYESLRPTNTLAEAANNTSLAPLDLGDGPAGTRAAGWNASTAEDFLAPRRLHAMQQIRAANHVLQSADPSGINAAGPGSNVGPAVVYRFAGKILAEAYKKTRNEKYLLALEEKAEKLLATNPRYADDLANRILFSTDIFIPRDENLAARLKAQALADLRRLRQLQRPDGLWQFDPGSSPDGFTWKLKTDDADVDPAPTALALTALSAMGFTDSDPQVKKGVAALLRAQDPYGRWNKHALTGMVTTAYSIHALARLYPATPPPAPNFAPAPHESLADTVARFRAMAQLGLAPEDNRHLPAVLPGAAHASPQVRYWAHIALGALHDERGVPAQLAGLSDPVKMVREAARWGLRQTLLDDKGWDHLFAALPSMDDLGRETLAGALIMRADATMTRSNAGFPRLTAALAKMMNQDPHPAVRAWASRAAWNWWIWNPPVRDALNAAFITSLETPEPFALTETAKRYQTEALFIVNGHRSNGSKEHQYPELQSLFSAITKRLGHPLLSRRIVEIAGTYYNQAGGDGGPGQMGYVTAGSAEMVGKAVYAYWDAPLSQAQTRLALEAAANATYDPLQKKLLEFSTAGPEEYRTLAATSLSDPRIITLNGTQEFLEPLIEQIQRGANEPERRVELVNPILKLFTRARWNLPKTEEQQNTFFRILLPDLGEDKAKLPENIRPPAQMEKDSRDWFLARSTAQILHNNPDLHTPALLSRMPTRYRSAMEEALWVNSAKWLLTYQTPVPAVSAPPPAADPLAPRRQAAAELVANSIRNQQADPRLRSAALSLAIADSTVRNHPTVKAALQPLQPGVYEDDPAEVKTMSAEWRKNYEYFRDWLAPELLRPNRDDELACLSCHGVAGRVPSMELRPADNRGYLSAANTFANYKLLLERVSDANVDQSKLLRKPLNVQSGKEDGHQGGRRYNPEDRAYEILRRWALDAARLKKAQLAPSGAL
ncbi:MAG: hypothetical protein ACK55F_00270 [Acidobacteriota bacterium]